MAAETDDEARKSDERVEYDSPWKEVSEAFFPDMMALLFPEIHADIDWSRGWKSLDQEFAKLLPDSGTGNRRADKLFQVYRRKHSLWAWLFNRGKVIPTEQLVHAHIEFQNQHSSDLERRVFVINYRVFDRYETPVVSLVVLGDESRKWRPRRFGWELWGFKEGIWFPSVKLLDFKRRKLEKLAATNPFAVVVMAHLDAQATHQAPDARLLAKFSLIRRLYESGYDRETIKALFRFIDWVMRLPEEHEDRLYQDLERLDTEKRMQYVTSWERRGIKKGIEKGIEKGLLQGKAALLKRQLIRRFGELPEWAEQRLAEAKGDDLDLWGENLLEAKNLASVFMDTD